MKNFPYLLVLCTLLALACNDNVDLSDAEALETVQFTDVLLDAEKNPLPGALVTMFANDLRYSDVTDGQGRYTLALPMNFIQTEGFMSMSITADGYKPKNITYEAPLMVSGTYDSGEEELILESCPNCIQLRGKASELYHLGDDNYGGPINSQFQKSTDGTEMTIELEVSPKQEEITLTFEAKGVQPDFFEFPATVVFGEGAHEIVIDQSPEDGSYGKYEMTVTNNGAINSVTFITRDRGYAGSDYDDWEFTSVYIEDVK